MSWGGFTTFSTYTLDIEQLVADRRPVTALLYLAGTRGRSPVCSVGDGERNTKPDQLEDAMRLTGTALRLTVMVGESDQWHHKPLFTEIVHRAHKAGLAGATVIHGIEGFGASSRIHTTRLLSLSEDLPAVVVIVDTHDRIHAFIPQLDDLVTEGLVILEDCEVIRYVGRDPDAQALEQAGPGSNGRR